MPQPHIDEERLDLYAVGSLNRDEVPSVEEHLLECEECQTRLAKADEFAALVREAVVRPDARPAPSRRRFWSRRAVLGIAAATTISLVIFVGGQSRRGPERPPTVVELQSLRGPETPAQIEAQHPAKLLLDLAPGASGSGYGARIVDAAGAEVSRPTTAIENGRLAVSVDELTAGSYWLRIYRGDAPEPVAEYGLRAR